MAWGLLRGWGNRHPAMELAPLPSQEANPRGRLLIVDDEENILRSLQRVLRRDEWEIETATDGSGGLEVLERFSPEVVISDFRMPGMNGVEFLTHVKQRAPRTQRIMLTGHADQSAIEEAINRSEIFRFISKPWNDSQLTLTVAERLRAVRHPARERAAARAHPGAERGAPAAERRARAAGRAAHPAALGRQARVGADLRLDRRAARGGEHRRPHRPAREPRLRPPRGQSR